MGAKGYCNLCREFGNLTLEHIPPQSSGNDKWTYVHTLYGLVIGSRADKAPPTLECRSGMGKHSLCERCNRSTARYYNEAFADWTLQSLIYSRQVGADNRISLTFHIRPLNVLKQIATMTIAAANVGDTPALRDLRRFVLLPFERHLPTAFAVRAYLNPLQKHRQKDKMLTQNRMAGTAAMMSIDGSAFHCMAEVAFPPMGYMLLFVDGSRISPDVAQLPDISFFGRYGYNQEATVSVPLPVRIPFGPAPGHYPKI